MPTNRPAGRATHVIRIFGTNKDDDVLSDIWVDVERINGFYSPEAGEDQAHSQQDYAHHFKWCDDPNRGDFEEHGNPDRREYILKVCDPGSDDLNDPDEWIPVRIIKSMLTVNSLNNYQAVMVKFNNRYDNQSRHGKRRRIVHYDTNIDDDAQTAADNGQKVYVVPSQQYDKDLDTKDEDDYVEHEIITYCYLPYDIFTPANAPAAGMMGVGSQDQMVHLQNQYLIDESLEAKLEEKGENNINPPYRLDPLQNIVNVQFGGAVKFFDKDS